MKKKMLITGVSGLLGNNLALYFRDKYDVSGWYSSHKVNIEGVKCLKVDIVFDDELDGILEECSPDIIIHCASLTDVDYCENHKELTKYINITGTHRLIEACSGKDIKFVYISTDAVYDGKIGNYSETDKVNPSNYYAQSKYAGEKEAHNMENALILRTNIFGWNIQQKESISERILNALLKGEEIKGFRDVCFSSIYTLEMAKIIEVALEKDIKGTYNCASSNSMSKYEFACLIADKFGLDKKLIQPIDVDTFSLVARRGKDLSVNVSKLSQDLNIKIPTIEECLDSFYQGYENGLHEEIKEGLYKAGWYPHADSIPYGRQSIDDDDINAVVDVLKSDCITQGDNVSHFEKILCDHFSGEFGVAVNSGTSALHIACLAAGVGPGDEIVTSPNTFVASANCAVYCGARPVFGDIDAKTYNLDPFKLNEKITIKTKAIIPVHFAGQSCDMEQIKKVVEEKEKEYGHKIYIIEDACHALGSEYKGTKVGSSVYSDMTVFSFHPVKHVTTGEGGAVLTNDESLARKLQLFRSHGITNTPGEIKYKERAFSSGQTLNPGYYEQQILGYNYRITDIQCALGISQMRKLSFFIKRRREIVAVYNKAFAKSDNIMVPHEDEGCISNWHLYVLNIDFEKVIDGRAGFVKSLKEKGIQTQVHYIPVHTQPFYMKTFGTDWGDCPNAEAYYKKCVSIPLYPVMTEEDVQKVIREVLLEVGE